MHWRLRFRDRPMALASVKATAITLRSYEGLLSQNQQQVSVYQCRMELLRDEHRFTAETTHKL